MQGNKRHKSLQCAVRRIPSAAAIKEEKLNRLLRKLQTAHELYGRKSTARIQDQRYDKMPSPEFPRIAVSTRLVRP